MVLCACLSYRPQYGDLVNMKNQFPAVPVMVLTATATPFIKGQLQKMLQDPVIEVSCVNKPNIAFHAMELTKLPKNGLQLLTHHAMYYFTHFPRYCFILFCVNRLSV